MLKEMTESLFKETLIRIAEDVWREKFVRLNGLVSDYQIKEMLAKEMLVLIKDDPEIREAFKAALMVQLKKYLGENSK